MIQMRWLSAAVLFVGVGQVSAAELVGVPGSNNQYTTTMDITIADKPVHLVLTGVALRQKLFFNVYAIGSYVLDGAAVHTAEELAALDVPKQLHLVMERGVEGRDMAEAFLIAIRQNYPTPNFDAEVSRLIEKIRQLQLQKGDHVYLTHQPGIGLRCQVIGKGDFTIDNPAFSRAVWDIYLGKNNVGDGIKKGLVSRLK
ncbi:MAG TPA: chalcone isomerase family protein [Gemmataceae bacterium]|nr:chalcone isomerase family protein [Gemmataceae bacterium]